MSKAKKCDRCGKLYEKNFTDRSIKDCRVTGMDIVTTGNCTYDHYDLCDECIEDVYKFIESKKLPDDKEGKYDIYSVEVERKVDTEYFCEDDGSSYFVKDSIAREIGSKMIPYINFTLKPEYDGEKDTLTGKVNIAIEREE